MLTTFMTRRILPATAFVLTVGLVAPFTAGAQDAALIKKGEQIYNAQKCATCHSIAGKGKKTNPLDGVGTKLSADDIRQWIVDPKGMAAKAKSTKKPPMAAKYSGLSPAELDALVAFLASLK